MNDMNEDRVAELFNMINNIATSIEEDLTPEEKKLRDSQLKAYLAISNTDGNEQKKKAIETIFSTIPNATNRAYTLTDWIVKDLSEILFSLTGLYDRVNNEINRAIRDKDGFTALCLYEARIEMTLRLTALMRILKKNLTNLDLLMLVIHDDPSTVKMNMERLERNFKSINYPDNFESISKDEEYIFLASLRKYRQEPFGMLGLEFRPPDSITDNLIKNDFSLKEVVSLVKKQLLNKENDKNHRVIKEALAVYTTYDIADICDNYLSLAEIFVKENENGEVEEKQKDIS